MHKMSDIGKKKIPRYVVNKGFNACWLVFGKTYMYYPIKIIPGDKVRILEGDAHSDFIIEIPVGRTGKFKRERVQERDWWLFDITMRELRSPEKLYLWVESLQFNPSKIDPADVFENYPATP